MLKNVVLFISSLVSIVTFAAPIVTDVIAKQRYPWNGLVDISCKVEGVDESMGDWCFVLSAIFPDSENTSKMSKFWVLRNGVKSSNLAVDANGNYRLLWDAKGDLGEVRYTNMVVRVTIFGHEKVQLWKDGPYWATTNIGAEKPEDYGYYFWWGDTVGYKRENNKWVASDGSNSNFSFTENNVPTYGRSYLVLKSEGWITADGALAPEHDAAHKHWGGDWRMPTYQELDDLSCKCAWTWTTMNGVRGFIVFGKGDYSSKSIFLPCTGLGSGTSLNTAGSHGYYWSSVPDSPYSDGNEACDLFFYSGFIHKYNYYHYRYVGLSVRPLQGFTK
jgi:hypothetical protein